MTWWVLTYLDNHRAQTSLFTWAATNQQDHLFMKWSRYKPSRSPIYRNVRGARVHCGYNYIWDTPNLTEQNESGNTFHHTFRLADLPPSHHVWYYLFAFPGPYALEIQGPLIHVPPPELHDWTPKAWVGTKLKGIFYTDTFTGPLAEQPTWSRQNQGLHSGRIWQLEPDPMGLTFGLWALVGTSGNRILYRRGPAWTPLWEPRLTNTDCVALTGAISGEMCWVATNRSAPQHVYVLFNSAIGDIGLWCIKSVDSGHTWNAFQVEPGILINYAGNISVGVLQGTSPYPPGSVLYTVVCWGLWWALIPYLSTDWGETWAARDAISMQLTRFRCQVDPTDHSIVYTGALVNLANPAELFRSIQHGANLAEVDGIHHLGIYLEPEISSMWIHATDHNWLTTLSHRHLWTSLDYSANWTDHGQTFKRAERLAILSPQPEHLYLARDQSADPPVHPHGPHVLYISDDYGATMYGKAGDHADTIDGRGDSIPYNCGGICLQGMQLFPID